MKERFKDKMLNNIYQSLIGETPAGLYKRKIFGSIHNAFERGYNGEPPAKYIPRNCAAHAAYVAGKESK